MDYQDRDGLLPEPVACACTKNIKQVYILNPQSQQPLASKNRANCDYVVGLRAEDAFVA